MRYARRRQKRFHTHADAEVWLRFQPLRQKEATRAARGMFSVVSHDQARLFAKQGPRKSWVALPARYQVKTVVASGQTRFYAWQISRRKIFASTYESARVWGTFHATSLTLT